MFYYSGTDSCENFHLSVPAQVGCDSIYSLVCLQTWDSSLPVLPLSCRAKKIVDFQSVFFFPIKWVETSKALVEVETRSLALCFPHSESRWKTGSSYSQVCGTSDLSLDLDFLNYITFLLWISLIFLQILGLFSLHYYMSSPQPLPI